MPRLPRIQIEGALYYVTSRSLPGQDLFKDKEDYQMYTELLGKYKNQYSFKLFAFVFMPGHLHLLVETKPETNLSDIMHNLTSAYTKYYNRRYSRQGHLFRGRFRAAVVEKEPYLLGLIRHIHLNPGQAGLAQDLADYQYSSNLCYKLAPSPNPSRQGRGILSYPLPPYEGGDKFLSSPLCGGGVGGGVLNLDAEISEAMGYLGAKSYADFMREWTDGEVLHKKLYQNISLGSEEFGKRVQEQIRQVSLREQVLEEEAQPAPRKLSLPIISGVILTALAGSFLLAQHRLNKKKPQSAYSKVNMEAMVTPAQNKQQEEVIAFELVGLDGSMWQIEFIAAGPLLKVDTLTFQDGRMKSENFSFNGYPSTNYSTSKEAGRVIWETIQTKDNVSASWRGEVESAKMRGILSLRKDNDPAQDFSFVSLKYARIKNEELLTMPLGKTEPR